MNHKVKRIMQCFLFSCTCETEDKIRQKTIAFRICILSVNVIILQSVVWKFVFSLSFIYLFYCGCMCPIQVKPFSRITIIADSVSSCPGF